MYTSCTGNPQSRPVYRCDKPNLMMGLPRCMTFGGPRLDAAIAKELLRTVEPMAIEAALEAERMHQERQDDQQRILDLELQQARYEAGLAERRYAACDPDNRLIAVQLEKNWEAALRRVQDLQARQLNQKRDCIEVDPNAFTNLADNLSAAWHAPGVSMRARQQLLRTLIADVIVDVDDEARDVLLTIHWRGGQHSQLRVRKPRAGEHGCATSEDALAVMRSMAGRWSDEHIAASLNRMGLPTGQGKTWTAKRVSSVRRVRDVHAYRSAEKDGEWLTLTEAAKAAGVSSHMIRRLIKTGTLRAEQVMRGAPFQIRTIDMASDSVKARLPERGARVALLTKTCCQCLQTLEEELHNDSGFVMGRMARSTVLVSSSLRAYRMALAKPLRGGMWVSWVSSQTFIIGISGRDLESRTAWRTVTV